LKIVRHIDRETHEIVIVLLVEDLKVFVSDSNNDILVYDLDFFEEYFRRLI